MQKYKEARFAFSDFVKFNFKSCIKISTDCLEKSYSLRLGIEPVTSIFLSPINKNSLHIRLKNSQKYELFTNFPLNFIFTFFNKNQNIQYAKKQNV